MYDTYTYQATCFCFDVDFALEVAKNDATNLACKPYDEYIVEALVSQYKKGKRSERLVFEACNSPEKPEWMKGARYALSVEDTNGIDVVLTTEFGEFPLQVKSSISGVNKFIAKYYVEQQNFSMGLVKIHRTDTITSALKKIVFEVEKLRSGYYQEKYGRALTTVKQ